MTRRRGAVDAVLDAGDRLTEPRLARDLVLRPPGGRTFVGRKQYARSGY